MAGTKLFVGCLPYSKTEDDLKPIFDSFGPVQEVSVIRKPDGSSKGAAFVIYQTADAAASAMSFLQNYTFPGSPRGLNISMSSSTGGGGGGGGADHQQQFQQQQQQYQQFVAAPAAAARPQMGSMAYGKGGQMNMAAQQYHQPFQYMVPTQAYAQHRPQFAHQPLPPATPYPAAARNTPGVPGSKVFVGQLPYSKSEGDLWQLFGAMGPVAEVALLKDKKTNEKKGAAFVRFHSAQHAAQAVAALDGFTFAGSPRSISVSLAQSEQQNGGEKRSWSATSQAPSAAKIQSMGTQAEGALDLGVGLGGGPFAAPQDFQEGAKLFVGQLPFSRSEEEIKQVFGSYGNVAEVFLHRDAQTGQKKGGAFVRFFTVDDAHKALELDGYVFQGATRPITVALAGEGGAKRQRIV